MGNNNEKINEAHKLIVDLSESKPISNDILSSRFDSLLTLTQLSGFGFDNMVEIFSTFNELTLQKFLNNLLTYHSLSDLSSNYPLNQVFTYIHSLFRIFGIKYNFNIKRCLYDCISYAIKDNTSIYSIFPVNLIKFSIETFISVKYNASKENKNEQTLNLLNCLQIIQKVIFSYNCIEIQSNKIVNVDLWKFILGNKDFISQETLSSFINDLCFYFFSSFEELVKYPKSRYTSTTELMKYALGCILYLFHDTNYFLFENVNILDKENQLHIYFQSNKDFNEAAIKYINIITNNQLIPDLIISYRKLFRSLIESYMKENYRIITDFISCLFDNYTSINENIQQILCYLLLELLYITPTIIDKCGIKSYVFQILNQLKEDFEENLNFKLLILINKLFLTKTFRQFLSPNTSTHPQSSPLLMNNNNNNDYNAHIETCIDYYLFFLDQMKISTNVNLLTLLMLPVNNLCILFPKMNNEGNSDEFSNEYFSIVKKVLNGLAPNRVHIRILFVNCFIENILLLLNKLEPRSTFLLEIVKNFDYLSNQVNIIKNEDSMKKYLDNIKENFKEIENINDKISMKFKEEGIDWKYAQDNQLLKIINKIMFFENSDFQRKLTLKDISIHNNKIEMEILYSNRNEELDIFNSIINLDFFSVSS